MLKAGRFLFLAAALFFAAGTMHESFAKTPPLAIASYENAISKLDKLTQDGLAEDFGSQVKTCIASSTLCSADCREAQVVLSQDESKALTQEPKELIPTQGFDPELVRVEKPTPTPTVVDQEAVSLDSDKIFDMVNSFRASAGLPPFEKNEEVCSLALTRSVELQAEAVNGTIHAGLYARPLPYWIFENAKYASDEAGTVAWWLASSLHHSSIVGNYKYSCVKCTGNYCSQLFTSFTPK